ncbi:MAG: molybdopterin-guanine dinucleotide biosynthesis protein B [Lachnospiraceae bacterium]
MEKTIIAVSGIKNSGKTTFLEHVIPLLKEKGLKVAVIKHDGHDFEPDVPGTDSWRLNSSGADGTVVYSERRWMIIRQEPGNLAEIIRQLDDCDIILLEGQKYSAYPKIELIRKGISVHNVCSPETLLAIATDTEFELSGIPRIGLDDYEAAAEIILQICSK